MSNTTIQTYYDSNMPRGKYVTGRGVWTSDSLSTIVINPSTDRALLVSNIKFQVSDDFVLTAGASFTITINAYDESPYDTITIDETDPILNILALGDVSETLAFDVGADSYLATTLKFKPPIYLKSSTTVVENITIEYTGALTSGNCIISYEAWDIDESESGL